MASNQRLVQSRERGAKARFVDVITARRSASVPIPITLRTQLALLQNGNEIAECEREPRVVERRRTRSAVEPRRDGGHPAREALKEGVDRTREQQTSLKPGDLYEGFGPADRPDAL